MSIQSFIFLLQQIVEDSPPKLIELNPILNRNTPSQDNIHIEQKQDNESESDKQNQTAGTEYLLLSHLNIASVDGPIIKKEGDVRLTAQNKKGIIHKYTTPEEQYFSITESFLDLLAVATLLIETNID